MDLTEKLTGLYGGDAVEKQKARYAAAAEKFRGLYGDGSIRVFSAPGRTEIGGNHTDHNCGCVLAAAVDLDAVAFVRKRSDNIINVTSDGFKISPVDVSQTAPVSGEEGTSEALIRGTAAALADKGHSLCGFDAYVTSDVLRGSGLSSSAAFEVLIGRTIAGLCCEDVSAAEIAIAAQYAENVHFGKPSGLMDQMASSVGGLIGIDFADVKAPIVRSLKFDLAASGYSLCIVDTKGSHADLTPEYAAVPAEMKAVAAFFGKSVLREITREQLLDSISAVREKCGDRAVLRALHFFDENERAVKEFDLLEKGDITGFLSAVNESGESSYKYLQNVFPSGIPRAQAAALGLYTAERVLKGRGAHRIHGGGFAGTIQAFVPHDMLDEFTAAEERIFGAGSCYKLRIRPEGGTEIAL